MCERGQEGGNESVNVRRRLDSGHRGKLGGSTRRPWLLEIVTVIKVRYWVSALCRSACSSGLVLAKYFREEPYVFTAYGSVGEGKREGVALFRWHHLKARFLILPQHCSLLSIKFVMAVNLSSDRGSTSRRSSTLICATRASVNKGFSRSPHAHARHVECNINMLSNTTEEMPNQTIKSIVG